MPPIKLTRFNSQQSVSPSIDEQNSHKKLIISSVEDESKNFHGIKNNKSKKFIFKYKMNYPHNSTYSSSSKYTSADRSTQKQNTSNPNPSELLLFQPSQSTYFNQLKQKYLQRDSSPQNIKQEMLLALQRKMSELEALRIHRDQLKFISQNNPHGNHIKIGFNILKDKAKAEEQINCLMYELRKDSQQMEREIDLMKQYEFFVRNSLKEQNDNDLIIDTLEEEKLMIENLQNETNHLIRGLRQNDKRNAKQIKQMQSQIGNLRVNIKQKQDKIRDLKSKICAIHIKLNSRNNISKEKNLSMSIKKFNSQQHNSIQQVFIGNKNCKIFSKEILEKVNVEQQLIKIVFIVEGKQDREQITFKCIYKTIEGLVHKNQENLSGINNINQLKDSDNKNIEKPNINNAYTSGANFAVSSKQTQIYVKNLLSMKFYFKSKIVGVQCRVKTENGNKHLTIGNCKNNIEHQLLTLVHKKIITLSSFWHQKQMVGVGVWFLNKLQRNNSSLSLKNRFDSLSNAKPSTSNKTNIYNQYYCNN